MNSRVAVGLVFVLVALAIVAAIFVLIGGVNPAQSNAIKIGAILPLTGNGMDQGAAQSRAIELAVAEANAAQLLTDFGTDTAPETSGRPREALRPGAAPGAGCRERRRPPEFRW